MRLFVLLTGVDITTPAMPEKVRGRANVPFVVPQPLLRAGAPMPGQPADGIVIRLIAPLYSFELDSLALGNDFAQFGRHVPAHAQKMFEQFVNRIRRAAPVATNQQKVRGVIPT